MSPMLLVRLCRVSSAAQQPSGGGKGVNDIGSGMVQE